MNKMKNLGSLFIVSLMSGAVTLGTYKFIENRKTESDSFITTSPNYNKNVSYKGAESIDFLCPASLV